MYGNHGDGGGKPKKKFPLAVVEGMLRRVERDSHEGASRSFAHQHHIRPVLAQRFH